MEYVVHAAHRALERGLVAHVADIELDLVRDVRVLRLILVPHVVLLLLVPRENAYLANVRAEKPPQDSISEGPRPSGNHQGFVFEDRHYNC